MATNYSTIANLPDLGQGSSGSAVQTLQNWLVQNGYMTQADMNTGPGTYGLKTKAAVANWQSSAGFDTGGNPGYFGPKSKSYIQTQSSGTSTPPAPNISSLLGSAATTVKQIQSDLASGKIDNTTAQSELNQVQSGVNTLQGMVPGAGTSGTTTPPAATTPPSTSQDYLDQLKTLGTDQAKQLAIIVQSLVDTLTQNKGAIPPGLQITPALTAQFLAWAHQVVDPQTQQLINQHITAINSNLQQMQTDYENQRDTALQSFRTNLATEQNQAGASGTVFSGLRGLTERNLAASTNRTLSSLAADTQNTIGQNLNVAGAQVGAANAGQFNVPSLTNAQVGIEGGSWGSSTPTNNLNFNYNPANYTMGTDISAGVQNVANQQANYQTQYGTLAANQSGRSMGDLIGQVTGLPSGYQIPTNLM